MRLNIIILLFLTMFSTLQSSDWSTIGSEHELLKDHIIIAVGSFSEEEKYDYDTFERTEWFKFKSSNTNFCFEFIGYAGYFGYGNHAALLLMDKDENLKIAIFDINISTIEVSVENIKVIECPSKY